MKDMTEISIDVTNVGGIESLERTLTGPVSIVTGTNASNKTSLLQAVAFGIGRSTVPIRSGANEAHVELKVGEKETSRTAKRKGRGIRISGDQFLDDEDDIELFERFACLLEFNDIRQAIREGRSIEDLLKEPMDLTNLESRRDELLQRKQSLKTEVGELEDLEDQITSKEEELKAKRDRVDSLEAKLDNLRKQQNATVNGDGEVTKLREEQASLVHKRNEHENQIQELKNAIGRIEDNLENTKSELTAAREEANSYDIDKLQSERDEIRHNLDDITDRVEVLQSVLTANREMLSSSYTGALGKETSLLEDTITCWACGNEAQISNFEETLEELRDIVTEDKERREEYQPKLETIESNISEAKQARSDVTDLEADVHDLENRLENRRESLETKQQSLEGIRDDIEVIDEELANHESAQESDVTDLQEDIEDVRVNLYTARSEIERLESSIEDLQDRLDTRERKKAELDDVSEEVVALSERIRTLEQDLREGFNDAINELIDVLEYEHIERIWLDGDFELIVAREVDGVVTEDDINHLSESEREMVGLVLALAGYITYELSEIAPVLLMDTLGAFDAERTADLVAYFADEAPLLLTALLPESASTVDEEIDQSSVHSPITTEAM